MTGAVSCPVLSIATSSCSPGRRTPRATERVSPVASWNSISAPAPAHPTPASVRRARPSGDSATGTQAATRATRMNPVSATPGMNCVATCDAAMSLPLR